VSERFSSRGDHPKEASSAEAIDPPGADLKRFLSEDHGGPVVMLNLLRLTGSGRVGDDTRRRRLILDQWARTPDAALEKENK
jgi:hypothetical protein